MFENDMKEKKTGIIEIEDLEDDTVNKMLSYLYTNAIEELDSSTAQKLYYAADRYGIKALLRICSNHLMHNLDTSNVCEILVLADTHQDEELKSYAKDFILVHVQEVINSNGRA
ncbi:hypothetical protein JTE90_024824 [Oedothorax gibbosus]|uniref:BTB domain-containing protein n=1 Tax=Oedothorax gibbosus TaxID=931172 RepID=A0AAV6TJZ8_9ARAC|nr:hypothetical protein JTE90_024824 [Oedothorax gibbosus]